MLAAEMPMIPQEIADEVRAYFGELSAWLATVLEQGAANGQFSLHESAAAEAQTFMSTVHGAMLTARALNNPESFQAIAATAIARLTTAA